MVRIKYRYLLVNILYPELPQKLGSEKVPDVIIFNQPTSDALASYPLQKAIEAEVAKLFGDYGAGAVKASLQSISLPFPLPRYLGTMC